MITSMRTILEKFSQRFRKVKLERSFRNNPGGTFQLKLQSGDCFALAEDEITYSLYVYRNFENTNRALWEKIICPRMVVMDIGANWGIYSISAGRLVGKQGKVFSFEPNPQEYAKLKKNISLNQTGSDNPIMTQEVAVGDYNGMIQFYVPPKYKGAYGSLKAPDIKEDCEVIEVPIISIDSFVKDAQLGCVNVIKIDVEGAESMVLRGALKTLERFKPMVLMEVSDKRTKAFGYKAQKLCEYLEKLGYEIYLPIESNSKGFIELKVFKADGYISYVDILAIIESNKKLIKAQNVMFN